MASGAIHPGDGAGWIALRVSSPLVWIPAHWILIARNRYPDSGATTPPS